MKIKRLLALILICLAILALGGETAYACAAGQNSAKGNKKGKQNQGKKKNKNKKGKKDKNKKGKQDKDGYGKDKDKDDGNNNDTDREEETFIKSAVSDPISAESDSQLEISRFEEHSADLWLAREILWLEVIYYGEYWDSCWPEVSYERKISPKIGLEWIVEDFCLTGDLYYSLWKSGEYTDCGGEGCLEHYDCSSYWHAFGGELEAVKMFRLTSHFGLEFTSGLGFFPGLLDIREDFSRNSQFEGALFLGLSPVCTVENGFGKIEFYGGPAIELSFLDYILLRNANLIHPSLVLGVRLEANDGNCLDIFSNTGMDAENWFLYGEISYRNQVVDVGISAFFRCEAPWRVSCAPGAVIFRSGLEFLFPKQFSMNVSYQWNLAVWFAEMPYSGLLTAYFLHAF